MSYDCVRKISSLTLSTDSSECASTEGQRVYSIHRVSPDPYHDAWKILPVIHEKQSLMKLISEQLQKPESFDVSVLIGDESFNCLMLILQSFSKYFKLRSRHDKIIALPSAKITAMVFQKIYKWMLMESKAVERENLIPLLIGAQFLEVEMLEQQIWNLIQDGERFQENEAFLLYLEARQSNFEKVQSMMMARVQKFFMTVVCSEEFLLMQPFELRNWLKLDSIGINSEVEVFYAIVRWLLHDWNYRNEFLVNLVDVVRFGLIQPWRIVEFRHNQNTGKLKKILENAELQGILESSLSYSTYRSCFGSDEFTDQFSDFLHRFGFKRLYPRETFDPDWTVRYKDSAYTYEYFEEYLNEIKTNALTNWKLKEWKK